MKLLTCIYIILSEISFLCWQFQNLAETYRVEFHTDAQFSNSVNGMIPRRFGENGPTLIDLSGFNPKRQEFDPEYDNDAEQLLAEMEFKDTDTEEERELKLRILHIYLKRWCCLGLN